MVGLAAAGLAVAGLACCGLAFCCLAGLEGACACAADGRGDAGFGEGFFGLGEVDGLGVFSGCWAAGRACCNGFAAPC